MIGTKIEKKLLPMYIGMMISLCLFGSYFEWSSCILTIYFMLYYVWLMKDEKYIQFDLTILLMIAIVFSYFVFAIFAVDYGVAFIGAVKYLPMIPFVCIISRFSVEERLGLVQCLPMLGVIMVMLSIVLSFNETLTKYLNVSGRLSGLFQYPNTFALFLLVGIIVVVERMKLASKQGRIVQTGILVVLLFGIFASGSRTCMIFLGVFTILSLVLRSLRVGGTYLGSILGIGVIISVVYTVTLGEVSVMGRYLTTSVWASTFVGRLLYAIDALPQILTHPLGLGYMGYLYTQGSFQSGVYEVAYVHNDFLQFFLDAGWIAGVAFVILTIRAIGSKKNPMLFRMIALFMALCTLLDFHFQYLSIFMIFALVLDYESLSDELYTWKYKTKNTKKVKADIKAKKKQAYINVRKVRKGWLYSLSTVAILISVYMGVALGSEYGKMNDLSLAVYPFNTRAQIIEMQKSEVSEEAIVYADKILEQNDSIALAYRWKAMYAFSQGHVEEMVEYKLQQIAYSRYNLEAYTELLDMLAIGQKMYAEAGMEEGVRYCQEVMDEVPIMLEEVEQTTSPLAWMIADKPELTLPEKYQN